MGVNGSSRRCCSNYSSHTEYVYVENPLNPDPTKFKIVDFHELDNGYMVAWINYPNCSNFEGNKIIVFRDMNKKKLLALSKLDPHFDKANNIVARFRPEQCWFQEAILMFDCDFKHLDKA